MPYDLFISYARKDNERGQIVALADQIKTSFRAFAGRDLRIFFDTSQIQGMDDWRQKIQRSLRESHLFLAVLSPNYLSSPYCRWEWEDYVRYEAMRQCLGEGVAPVFFITLPDASTPQADQAIARWIDEINHRQTFDLRPWHDHGEKALQETHVQTTLEQLQTSVRERLARAERARRSPNNLIKHNPAFVGRVRELTELRNALTRNKFGVVGAREGQVPGRATVQGLGGMGKTELALAYAHAFAWDYPGGRWQIPCEHTSDLRLALSRLAGPMHFEFTEEEKKDLPLQFERVLREIQLCERCLLILDNVSDPHLLEPEYLDRLPREGHVDLIATTRLAPSTIPGSAQDTTFIAVDELPEEDALSLMRSHQPEGRFVSQDDDNEARRIARLLRGFTLAVETAAIYLGRNPAPDACRRFRERLSPDLLLESEQAATNPTVAVRHRVRSLDETFAFTLATLTPEARHLLDYAALLPADQVAVPWLRVLGAERFPAFQDAAAPPFRQPLNLLLGLRLFQQGNAVDADGRLLVTRMHRLVQQLIKRGIPAEQLSAMQPMIAKLVMERAVAIQSISNWQESQWELEVFDALWAEIDHPGVTVFLNQIGMHWHQLSEWKRAESLIRRALVIDKANLRSDHPDVARDLNNLGRLLLDTNRLGEAELLLRQSLDIYERSIGKNHSNVAAVLHNLAGLLLGTNRKQEAEEMMRRALTIDERNSAPEHPDVARDLCSLADLLLGTNRLAEAEPLLHRALSLYELNPGSLHLEMATVLNNMAHALMVTYRLEEAEVIMLRALAIDERNLGPNHINVARDLNNLSQLFKATHRLAEAEPLMRRALGIVELKHGPCHPDVAACANNLAQLLKATNRPSEAELLIRRVVEIFLELASSTGRQHPHLQAAIGNYTGLLQHMGRSTQEVLAELNAVGQPFGIQFG